MKDKDPDKRLIEIYRARLQDRRQWRSRRLQKRLDSPQKLESLLYQFFEKDSTALRRIEENRALQAWPDYVGECAARVAFAQRVRGNQLIVRVLDPLWMQQLSLLKQHLIKRFQTDFPALQIRDIYFTRN